MMLPSPSPQSEGVHFVVIVGMMVFIADFAEESTSSWEGLEVDCDKNLV